MAAVKRMMVEAEEIATKCLDQGGSYDEAIDMAFDFIWAHANDEKSEMHHALEMAKSLVIKMQDEKLNS